MDQMNDKSLDRHFAKQLRMLADVFPSNISKSDFSCIERWLHVFNMASNTQDKYARNNLMLLMYGQLREMGKLGMPFIRKRNVRRPLVDVLSEYQGIEEVKSDTAVEPERGAHKGLMGEAEGRHCKPQREPREAQSKKEMKLKEVARQPRPEPKLEALPNSNTMFPLQARGPELKQLDGGNQEMDFHKDDTNFATVSQQDQAPIWDINHMYACPPDNKPHSKEADTSRKRRQLQMKPLVETVSRKEHTRAHGSQHHYKQAHFNWKRGLFQERPSRSSQLLLAQIKRDAHMAMQCLRHWNTESGPLNFFNITLQHMLDDGPETRKQLFELDQKLESLLSNMLEQVGERREKNVRILYDQLFKQQQETLNIKHELIRKEQRAVNLARQELDANVQDFKRQENLFWQQKQSYQRRRKAANMPTYVTEVRRSSYQCPRPPLAKHLRSSATQTDRKSSVASTFEVAAYCGYDHGGVNGTVNNRTSTTESCSGVCGCSECLAACESLQNGPSLVEICQCCPPGPLPEGGNRGRAT